MKEKKWIFFRVMVYLVLVVSIIALALLTYYFLTDYRNFDSIGTLTLTGIVSLSIQIAFNILNIRLIHHYLFNKLPTPATFNRWHTVLLALNSCIAIALICLFLYGSMETFKTSPYHKSPNTEDVVALILIGTYTFITICTITGAFILRRYIKYFTTRQDEEWLSQIGSSQINE